MYKIPEDFDLSPLVKSKVISISRSFNTLTFNFENNWSITCDGPIGIELRDELIIIKSSERWTAIEPLFKVLELEINDWGVESSNSFRITFENETSIIFFDSSSMYESFHFSPKEWTI